MNDAAASRVSRGRFSGKTWMAMLHIATSIVLIYAAVFLITRGGPEPPPPPISPPPAVQPYMDAPIHGESSAPVGLIVYSDFQCPVCRQFARDVMPLIDDRYVKTGKAFLAFRHYPLVDLHPQAMTAARIAECASQQGMFWKTHDLFFGLQVALTEQVLLDAAYRAGADSKTLRQCLLSESETRIALDQASGRSVGVKGTPHLFIGRRAGGGLKVERVFGGLPPATDLFAALDEVIRR